MTVHTQEQEKLREQYLIGLAEATFPLKKQAEDLEVSLELLIEAAGMLQEHLRAELAEVRAEQD
jgi:ribosomal protein S15P/S13E